MPVPVPKPVKLNVFVKPVPVPVLERDPLPVPVLERDPVPVLERDPVPVPVLERVPVPVPVLARVPVPVPVPVLERVPVPVPVPVFKYTDVPVFCPLADSVLDCSAESVLAEVSVSVVLRVPVELLRSPRFGLALSVAAHANNNPIPRVIAANPAMTSRRCPELIVTSKARIELNVAARGGSVREFYRRLNSSPADSWVRPTTLHTKFTELILL